jgi:Skp family chaperone for outer membrane proteins
MVTASAGTPPNSPKKHREKSPGRGSSHVVSAAAAAAVAADWIANVRNSNVVSASREAEKAASELAARLQAVQHKKEEAAAEAQRLEESMVKGAGSGNGGGGVAAAVAAPSKLGYMGAARSKVCAGCLEESFWG